MDLECQELGNILQNFTLHSGSDGSVDDNMGGHSWSINITTDGVDGLIELVHGTGPTDSNVDQLQSQRPELEGLLATIVAAKQLGEWTQTC